MKKRVVLIIQARMGSTRLPGKSMMDLAGAPLVGRILERVKRCTRLDDIVLAIPDTDRDAVLRPLAERHGIKVFAGSENDLVERYYQAALWTKADIVGRLPADNATPEPSEIDRIVDHHLSLGRPGFSSNLSVIGDSGYPDGIGAEMFDFSLLAEARDRHHDPRQREHVHLNFYDYGTGQAVDASWCPISTIKCPEGFRRPDLVLDVNTQAQYEFMRQLYEYLYPKNRNFHITDTIRWYDEVYSLGRSSDSDGHKKSRQLTNPSTDYHDYVFRDGKLLGEFEEMYRRSSTTPWHQDEQDDWIDVRLTREMLSDIGPFDEIHDMGCGLGNYLGLMKDRVGTAACECFGYDISETACSKAGRQFPDFQFAKLDLTRTSQQPSNEPKPGRRRLFMLRGTLWYVFPKLDAVINTISGFVKGQDTLLVVQNFPPLAAPFIGKEVIPNHKALIDRFSSRFRPVRHIWYEDTLKAVNDNWFIGIFSVKDN